MDAKVPREGSQSRASAPDSRDPGAPAPDEEEAEYFSQLLGYSMERLAREPELLASEQAYLARQMEETVSTHRSALIDSAVGARQLSGLLAGASSRLDSLDAALPRLQARLTEFEAAAARSAQERRLNRQLADSHGTLLDLLETPALMTTCVRNRHYDEALDLRAFLRRLAVLHGPTAPVAGRLAAEAEAGAAAMQTALLRSLETDLALHECLRAVGYLRRLGALPERELRLEFLARREIWVTAAARGPADAGGAVTTAKLASPHRAGNNTTAAATAAMQGPAASSAAYEALRRATDALRLNCFEVVSQYLAVFGDERRGVSQADVVPHAAVPGAAQSHAKNSNPAAAVDDILARWALRRVSTYAELVDATAPVVTDGAALASLLEGAAFAGAALARVGLDPRPLLAPAFERAAVGLFRAGLAGAEARCLRLVAAGTWGGRRRAGAKAAGALEPATDGASSGTAATTAHPGTASHAPPESLLDHLPLAAYANGACAALNELRHCAPLVLAPEAAAQLRASLLRVDEAVREAAARGGGGAMAPPLAHPSTPPSHRPVEPEPPAPVAEARRALQSVLAPFLGTALARTFAATARSLQLDSASLRDLFPSEEEGDAAGDGAGVPVSARIPVQQAPAVADGEGDALRTESVPAAATSAAKDPGPAAVPSQDDAQLGPRDAGTVTLE